MTANGVRATAPRALALLARSALRALLVLLVPLASAGVAHGAERTLVVGSKAFTESVILGEIVQRTLAREGVPARHARSLGGSRVLFEALARGDIDAYVEYSGTLRMELLAPDGAVTDDGLAAALAKRGIAMAGDLGFSNTYVLGTTPATAARLGLVRISDLRAHPELRLGFSNEFAERADGWPALRAHYSLTQRDVRGLDHQLAYRALVAGDLDVTDFYATDPEIQRHGLVVLQDDAQFFPEYRALLLHRADLPPRAIAALRTLAGRIDAPTMRAMNADVNVGGVDEARAARRFLAGAGISGGGAVRAPRTTRYGDLPERVGEHLVLTGAALAAAILVGIPVGVACSRRPRLARFVLAATGVLQTIPSLALLVLMIPVLGIGFAPAVAALFLYGLLPIVRNTCSGLLDVSPELRDSALALGLDARTRLLAIELPLAARAIFAGVRTAAVIAVGTATLAALVGAGGLGQPILSGIRLADTGLILAGAVPAALLALGVDWGFARLERLVLGRRAIDGGGNRSRAAPDA